MTPEELFTAALGLGRQWRVAECRFEGEPKRLELRLEHMPGEHFECPVCKDLCGIHDTIERRWGATGSELESCTDGEMKSRWYKAEQRLRNQIDRTYEVYMGFSVAQLEGNVLNSGWDKPPTTDIKALIDNIGYRTPFVGMKPVGR